jgi:hypothetical protein
MREMAILATTWDCEDARVQGPWQDAQVNSTSWGRAAAADLVPRFQGGTTVVVPAAASAPVTEAGGLVYVALRLRDGSSLFVPVEDVPAPLD